MTKDELKRFCAKEDIRYYLNDLINVGAFTYACNGHIAVRVPRLVGEEESNDESAKNIAGKIDEYLQVDFGNWISVPECKAAGMEACLICHGTGIHECSCGHEHECPDCEGSGKQEAIPMAVKVGDSFFADKYLAMIQGWEISVQGGMKFAGIRCKDAFGALMPRREY